MLKTTRTCDLVYCWVVHENSLSFAHYDLYYHVQGINSYWQRHGRKIHEGGTFEAWLCAEGGSEWEESSVQDGVFNIAT